MIKCLRFVCGWFIRAMVFIIVIVPMIPVLFITHYLDEFLYFLWGKVRDFKLSSDDWFQDYCGRVGEYTAKIIGKDDK